MDDFKPQPYQGDQGYPFNRLEGDRGAVNDSIMVWGHGQVTTTIAAGQTWGGGWMSLNHPIREGLPINFSAILPAQIQPAYQSQITGITVRIVRGTPGRTFRLELKDHGAFRWTHEITLNGGAQIVSVDLPALGNVNELVWVLDRAAAGDSVVLDSISFTATTQITDTATAAFVWSYGQLLNNWNPATGLVRDKAKDASGEFDAIQATGSLAAATAHRRTAWHRLARRRDPDREQDQRHACCSTCRASTACGRIGPRLLPKASPRSCGAPSGLR